MLTNRPLVKIFSCSPCMRHVIFINMSPNRDHPSSLIMWIISSKINVLLDYFASLVTVLNPAEPIVTMGTMESVTWDDNWTTLTADGSLAAQFSHTVLITQDGVEVLTRCWWPLNYSFTVCKWFVFFQTSFFSRMLLLPENLVHICICRRGNIWWKWPMNFVWPSMI